MTTILVVGISGVGKSTVLDAAIDQLPENVRLTVFGDLMLKLAKEDGIVDNRDQLKHLRQSTQKELKRKAAAQVPDDSDTIDIIDTHAVLSTGEAFIPTFSPSTLDKLNPDHIFTITAASETVNRRRSDPERNRSDQSLEGVRRHQCLTRQAVVTAGMLSEAKLRFFNNDRRHPEEVGEEVATAIQTEVIAD